MKGKEQVHHVQGQLKHASNDANDVANSCNQMKGMMTVIEKLFSVLEMQRNELSSKAECMAGKVQSLSHQVDRQTPFRLQGDVHTMNENARIIKLNIENDRLCMLSEDLTTSTVRTMVRGEKTRIK